jgi:hypothetical protein
VKLWETIEFRVIRMRGTGIRLLRKRPQRHVVDRSPVSDCSEELGSICLILSVIVFVAVIVVVVVVVVIIVPKRESLGFRV